MRKLRLIEMLVIGAICAIILVGCGTGSSSNSASSSQKDEEAASEPQGASDEDIKKAVEKITSAKESIQSCASYQLDGWTTYSNILNYYFDDSAYEEPSETSIKNRAKNAHDARTSATTNMEEAKALLGTNGEGDYYEAAKDYYIAVNKFLSLVSTFPTGYSQLTYSQAVKDAISDCETAYGELSFY